MVPRSLSIENARFAVIRSMVYFQRPMTAPDFKDHFSARAATYAQFRPTYPPALLRWLAESAPARRRAWDCATGNGQAAVALAEHMAEVVATDASAQQVAAAAPHPRVRYRVEPAEASSLDPASVDLITVAQALHWFDHARFAAEVHRVARPGALVAAWCYALAYVTPEVDRVMEHLYVDLVGPYWPPERLILERGYADVPFPFEPVEVPAFAMEAEWSLGALEGYLRSWSASTRYEADHGKDPVAQVHGLLAEVWGAPDTLRTVRWPLAMRAGRVRT